MADEPETPPIEPEIIEPEQTEVSIEARIAALEARLDALDAAFASHEHVESEDEPEPGTPAPPADEGPRSDHFWFRRINE